MRQPDNLPAFCRVHRNDRPLIGKAGRLQGSKNRWRWTAPGRSNLWPNREFVARPRGQTASPARVRVAGPAHPMGLVVQFAGLVPSSRM
jgi:hypothetical protein